MQCSYSRETIYDDFEKLQEFRDSMCGFTNLKQISIKAGYRFSFGLILYVLKSQPNIIYCVYSLLEAIY